MTIKAARVGGLWWGFIVLANEGPCRSCNPEGSRSLEQQQGCCGDASQLSLTVWSRIIDTLGKRGARQVGCREMAQGKQQHLVYRKHWDRPD